MKAIYMACCTLIYKGSLDVEADSLEEARELARQELGRMTCPEDLEGFDLAKSKVDCVVIKKLVEK